MVYVLAGIGIGVAIVLFVKWQRNNMSVNVLVIHNFTSNNMHLHVTDDVSINAVKYACMYVSDYK